jgi:outer membrane murein-binding lipoprotein Lpp
MKEQLRRLIMIKRTVTSIVMAIGLTVGMMNVSAQEHNHGEKKPPAQDAKKDAHRHGSVDMNKMMQEPHHVLAMAYVENLTTFAKALRNQVEATKSVDPDFARAAVGELRRSFDTMQQHLAEYSKTMPADQGSYAGAMQEMNAHVSAIRQSLTMLEREVEAAAPQASKVSERAAEIIKHIDEMSHSHGEHEGHKM